ncbi:hypothetical protein F9U64_22020 [Gracilibacillus oryzae]|uniref:Uncharacterized protein n=1 Tax=Gracilibacillus oryzae TaxID=1672701 RepID=A0A7C8GQF1_9BACI|nr:hypothetical protein [Gracilibacillus oryzae]KAB8125665.1 hypothetical protein F9U64_22020 [Gracilibacillus oryzae]
MSNSVWKKLTIITGILAVGISVGSIFILGENTPEGFMVVDADRSTLLALDIVTGLLGFVFVLGMMRSIMGNKLNMKTVISTILIIIVIIIFLEISHSLRGVGE